MEEGDASLACNRTGKQCLTSTWRAQQEDSLRNLCAKRLELSRVFQKLYDFHQVLFGFFNTGNIIKCHALAVFGWATRFSTTKAHRLVVIALHRSKEDDPDQHHYNQRQERTQCKTGKDICEAILLNANVDAFCMELVGKRVYQVARVRENHIELIGFAS